MLKTVIVIVFLIWILWLFYTRFDEAFGPQEAAVVCSDDVGFCPDGTSVSRSGPSCQFESCP